MIFLLLFLVFIFLFLLPTNVWAVCPVCTVAVGVGIGLSRWLGIDDTVSGIWIGGFLISSSLWLDSYLASKKINWPKRTFSLILAFYLVTILPLYFTGIIGHPQNTLWGIDKLLVGIFFGSVLFSASIFTDRYLRSKNSGKVIFYYQRVILPVVFLLFGSGVFYLITR